MTDRYVADCREFPSEMNCTVVIAGSFDEVLDLSVHHAVETHGHTESDDLRGQLRGMMSKEN